MSQLATVADTAMPAPREAAPPLHPALSVSPLFSLIRRWPNFLNPQECDDLLDGVDIERRWQQRLHDPTRPGGIVNLSIRNSKQADTSRIRLSLRALFRRVVLRTIEPAYGLRIEWIEEPQLLIYETGGHYAPHADTSARSDRDAIGRDIDRDISLVLYLNDGFAGGTLLFPRLGIEIEPTPGLLLAFPSDARFVHGAMPVTAGLRLAVVTWLKAEGTCISFPPSPGFRP